MKLKVFSYGVKRIAKAHRTGSSRVSGGNFSVKRKTFATVILCFVGLYLSLPLTPAEGEPLRMQSI